MIIRNDNKLTNISQFADMALEHQKESIVAKALLDINRCRFVPNGTDLEEDTFDIGILDIGIDATEMLSVNMDNAVYMLHLRVNFALRFRSLSNRHDTPPFI